MTTWLLTLLVAAGSGAATGALITGVIWLVGRESHERRGMLRFDTPEARAALRDPDDWFDPPEDLRIDSDRINRRL